MITKDTTMDDNDSYSYWTTPTNECPPTSNGTRPGYCAQYWDQILCWPETPAGSKAEAPCPNNIERTAHRFCPPSGSWEDMKTNYTSCIEDMKINYTNCIGGSKTNYTSCLMLPELPDEEDIRMAMIIRDITFTLSIISLVLLLITIFIFQYFRSLHCSRISIHKHLVVSFIVRFVVNIIVVEPYIANRRESYRDIETLCKMVRALTQYTILANTFWMFVEGFFLHHSLVLGVFSTEPPFKLFYFIGWGMPAMFVLSWALVLHYLHDSPCWADYSQTNYQYIITVPFILALVLNLVFLVNIIRVLVSKLRANNRVESNNIRKAIKATVVLMPLLGLTNFIFFINPSNNKQLQTAYRVTNAVLSSSQGIFVAFLYCFMNGEVQRVLKRKWYSFKIRQVLHTTSSRRRSSRTSSFFLTSATECPNTAAEQLRLLQANIALQNETITSSKDKTVANNSFDNGTASSGKSGKSGCKRNNNNGEVHFNLPPEADESSSDTDKCLSQRETVM